jgi:hypothetical protein
MPFYKLLRKSDDF